MKVDVHAHFYPKAYLDTVERLQQVDPRLDSEVKSTLGWARRVPIFWTADRLVEALEKMALDMQVLSLSLPNVYFADRSASVEMAQLCNDTFIELSRSYPSRFRVFASVPLHFPEEAFRELERVADVPEVVGVVLGANCHHRPLSDPEFMPFYAELERRELPIFIHPMCAPGHEEMQDFGLAPMVGYLFDDTLAALRLVFSGVLERHPRLTVILPHLGGVAPYMLGRVRSAFDRRGDLGSNLSMPPDEYFKRFYYDTVSRSVPALRFTSGLYGADHLMFGTDFPFWTEVEAISRDVEAMGLSDEDREKVFSGNALRILRRLKLEEIASAPTGGE